MDLYESLQTGAMVCYITLMYLYTLSYFYQAQKTDKEESISKESKQTHNFLKQWSGVGLIMTFCYFCEYSGFFPEENKTYSRDVFLFISLLFFGIAIFTIRKTAEEANNNSPISTKEESTFMNRHQTEEWKGWMQFLFLMYHYFRAMEYYNFIRVLVSSYAFLTGYGNYHYFATRNDFSFKRIFFMLFRLNFLTVLLMMTMQVPYILYYIVPLHTFYFLFTFLTMRIFSNWNSNFYLLRLKLIIIYAIVWILWDTPDWLEQFELFDIVFSPFKFILQMDDSLHEWHFRTYLDHYSTLYGIVFAIHIPQLIQWFKEVESFPPLKQHIVKLVMASYLLIILYWWCENCLTLDKFDYNAIHPYTTFIPIFIYLFLRNLYPTWRNYHSEMCRIFGTITLESYLLQYHLFLSGHAKTLLFYVQYSQYNLVNLIVAFAVLCVTAYYFFHFTNDIRAPMCDYHHYSQLIIRWVLYLAVLIFFSFLSYLVDSLLYSTFASLLIVTLTLLLFRSDISFASHLTYMK